MMKFFSSRTIVTNLAATPIVYSVVQVLLDKVGVLLPALISNPILLAAVTALLPIINMWLRTQTTTPLEDRANFQFLTAEKK